MKLKDDKGKYEIVDIWGITYVGIVKRKIAKPSRSRRGGKTTNKWFVNVEFNSHEYGLSLEFKNKAEAKAAYRKVLKGTEVQC